MLSVIIISHNTKKLVQNCLYSVFSSLTAVEFLHEVIVVDNASTDGTPDLLKKYPELIILRNHENIGFGKANNQAIERARGDTVLLLNSDTVVLDGGVAKPYPIF